MSKIGFLSIDDRVRIECALRASAREYADLAAHAQKMGRKNEATTHANESAAIESLRRELIG